MKKYLFIVLISGFLQAGAQIPDKATIIIVQGVTLNEVVNRLLDSGYTINKIDSNFNTIETDERKAFAKSMSNVILKIRIKDSSAIITGLYGMHQSGLEKPGSIGALVVGVDIPIGNYKQWVKKKHSPFKTMNDFALSFNKPVEYKVQ